MNRETGISASRKMDQTDNTEERRYRRDRKKEDLLMGMNATPASERVHIGFFGCRNAGKSSVMNAVTGQNLAVVSEVKGTT